MFTYSTSIEIMTLFLLYTLAHSLALPFTHWHIKICITFVQFFKVEVYNRLIEGGGGETN